MQTQSPFVQTPPSTATLLGLASPSGVGQSATSAAAASNAIGIPPVNMATFPTAFAAFASQIRNTQLQTLLQSQIAALNGQVLGINNNQQQQQQQQQHQSASRVAYSTTTTATTTPSSHGGGGGKAARGTNEYPIRKRVGGSTVKTAKVWRYFDELPTVEQAAECRICRKKIKATNSSTTGMIRHLRSCHVQEYQVVQEARQNSMIIKMEEKARAKLLREMNEKVTTTIGIDNQNNHVSKKENSASQQQSSESQKSPSASSSASDTASSASSSHFSANHLSLLGLPAPKPIKQLIPSISSIKHEATEVEEETTISNTGEKPTDLSVKGGSITSAFSSVTSPESLKIESYQKKIEEDHKIHMQIALMLLLDQQPTHVIDRPGFRSLFKFLLPDYQLPTGAVFQCFIVPQLLNHMKQQIGAIFNNNSSQSDSTTVPSQHHPHHHQQPPQAPPPQQQQPPPPPAQAPQQSLATSVVPSKILIAPKKEVDDEMDGIEEGGDEEGEEEEEEGTSVGGVGRVEDDDDDEEDENVEIEDDTSSAASSSMDTETCDAMSSFIHFIGSDTFPQDELISLLSVITNLFNYFSTRPLLQSHLSMIVPPSPTSSSSSSQHMSRQVQFVASNLSTISNYIRHTPDMQLLPLSASQETMLQKLADHISDLQ